jgi:hypothetical protein
LLRSHILDYERMERARRLAIEAGRKKANVMKHYKGRKPSMVPEPLFEDILHSVDAVVVSRPLISPLASAFTEGNGRVS